MSFHHITAHLELTEGADMPETCEMMQALAQATRREPGCIRFDVLQDLKDPRRLTLWECWRSPEALTAHFGYLHTKAALARGLTRVVSQETLGPVSVSPAGQD